MAAGGVLGLGRHDERLAGAAPDGLERQLVAVHQAGVGATVMSKSSGVTFFCSFSSQEPQGMNAALPWFHAVCDWMWSGPRCPGACSPCRRSRSSASAAVLTAGCFQAFGSRLSIAAAGPPAAVLGGHVHRCDQLM